MKTFTIAVSLAFLGACHHSVYGIGEIDKALPDGICSTVRDLEVCPLASSRCAYETIRAVSHDYGMYTCVCCDVNSVACHLSYFPFSLDNTIKVPCATPGKSAKCELSDNDEEGCLKKGCIWIHMVWTAQRK